MKVMGKVGATQEHVRKALDIKLSIESTVSRICKLNVVNVTDSQQMLSVASPGKQLSVSLTALDFVVAVE